MQGPDVVRPYTTQYKVTFPVAVDQADVFGQAFGLKAIPVSYLVDEVGILRLKGGGPSKEFLAQVESVLEEPLTPVRGTSKPVASAQSAEALEARLTTNPDDWKARLALAQRLDAEGKPVEAMVQLHQAAILAPQAPEVQFTMGLVLMRQGVREEGLKRLKSARDLDPTNWRIRKQIWALEHPEKFYEGHSPDYGWQNEQLKREKAD